MKRQVIASPACAAWLLCTLALGLGAAPRRARASGAVKVVFIGPRASVSLEQTFRKILGRDGGDDYRSVREELSRRLGRVLPALERVLQGESRRHHALRLPSSPAPLPAPLRRGSGRGGRGSGSSARGS